MAGRIRIYAESSDLETGVTDIVFRCYVCPELYLLAVPQWDDEWKELVIQCIIHQKCPKHF